MQFYRSGLNKKMAIPLSISDNLYYITSNNRTYMQKICFLSTDNLEDFYVWDDLLIPHFAAKGYTVDVISWRAPDVDWSNYELVIVRSTWDYQDDPQAFTAVLARIEASATVLANPYALMQWNISKWYLQDLASDGVTIIPSRFYKGINTEEIALHFQEFASTEIVIKPLISANSDNTFRLTPESLTAQADTLNTVFNELDCMVQPFLKSIISDGEYSLFYFNGQYSHAIKKVPKQGDFRVQEEHGGQLYTITPDMEQMIAAKKVLAKLPEEALYARVDLVFNEQQWQLMEVELIEPSLYFNMDKHSPAKFVAASLDYLNK